MDFTFTVHATADRESGKFRSREEVASEISVALDDANPGDFEVDESAYTIVEWDVEEVDLRSRPVTPVARPSRADTNPIRLSLPVEDVTYGGILDVADRLSSGERAIAALCAHVDDRPGVVAELGSNLTLVGLLASIDTKTRQPLLDLLDAAVAEWRTR